MTYAETVEFLFSKLPMYQRVGNQAFKKDLTNTLALCKALGNPQDKFRSIHIAGTNGKGSCSHMLSAICQKSGLKTGLYTSPHLVDYRERIRINGICVSEAFVMRFVEELRPVIEQIEPSFFEITVAMAFKYFAEEEVDIAVIETGLGGRLDSTNVITPILSLITNIDYDHMDLLGNTLEAIASEKAGIIKAGVPVVIGEFGEETAPVFRNKAQQMKAPIRFADADDPTILANYREVNKRTVRATCKALMEMAFPIRQEIVEEAIEHAFEISGLKGRWQFLGENPTVLCDTGHNKAGIRWIVKQLNELTYNRLHMVIGMVRDKDHNDILALLPTNAQYYWCRPDIPRGLDASELKTRADKFRLIGDSYQSVPEAYQAALEYADPKDLIFIGGSTFVVGDLLKSLNLSTCQTAS